MKDSLDSTGVGRAIDPETFANRKLIRPAFNRNDHRHDGDRRNGCTADPPRFRGDLLGVVRHGVPRSPSIVTGR